MAPNTPEQVFVTIEGKQLAIAASQLVTVVIDQAPDVPDYAFFTLINASQFASTIAVGKEIKLDLQQDKKRLNIFMGDIFGVEPHHKGNGEVLLHVRCLDQSHLMTRGRISKTYVQVTDSDVASTIARKYGWGTDIEPTSVVHAQISQHNTADLEFLRIRAARIGYQVGVNDKKLYFKKKGSPIRPGAAASPVELEYPKTVSEFDARVSSAAQPKKVIVRGWDAKTKAMVMGEATHSDKAPETKLGPAGAGPAGKFDTDGELSVYASDAISQKEAEILAQAKLDELATNFVTGEGKTAGNPSLQPGAKIKVTGVGELDGTYTISDTLHKFTRSGYQTEFHIGHGAPEAAPGASGENSRAKAPQFGIGVVTDNEDPDGQGRIKVKLPWLDDKVETFWCRMVVPAAGKDRGFFWLPEVGDEVAIAFEQGDPSKPFVVGCLWNGLDVPPKNNKDVKKGSDVVKRLMKSRSGHIIEFDDTSGDEKVEIQDKNGNSIVFECKTDKLTIEFKGDIEMSSEKNIKIKAGMNLSLEAGMAFSAKGSTTAEIEGSASTTVKAGASLALNGATVSVNNGAIMVA